MAKLWSAAGVLQVHMPKLQTFPRDVLHLLVSSSGALCKPCMLANLLIIVIDAFRFHGLSPYPDVCI